MYRKPHIRYFTGDGVFAFREFTTGKSFAKLTVISALRFLILRTIVSIIRVRETNMLNETKKERIQNHA